MPENVATKSDVEVSQTAAENAQTAADKNKKVLDGAFGSADTVKSVATFTFDKQTSGRDTFVYNAFHFYKISDFNPSPSDVISFVGTNESGREFSIIQAGENCVEYGLFIVVAFAGKCSLSPNGTVAISFTAPSAGIYAKYMEGNSGQTAGTGEFTLKSTSITGLFLTSSTPNSTKKFKITVDDSGTLSTTEVTW